MDEDKLKQILNNHKMWLDNKGGCRADLSGANLRSADLRSADLRGANLSGANLRSANLRDVNLRSANLSGADLDFSCWPLWCGSKGVKVDRRIATQLAAHFCALDCDDDDYRKARSAILKFAKTSHVAYYIIGDVDKSPDDKSQSGAK